MSESISTTGSKASTGYASAFDLYHRLGWPVLPLPYAKKKSPPAGFTGRTGKIPSYADMLAWSEDPKHRNGNLAIRVPRNVIGIDVDNYGKKRGAATLTEAENNWACCRPPTELPPGKTADRASGSIAYPRLSSYNRILVTLKRAASRYASSITGM